ncbi:WXG100 family type VII secretion target [Bacillus sp. B1-b2]|nr:WXG100 family type VII secretion target [Bacillus sp. B1-b2]
MDSSRVRDLANEFSRAADSVKESETKLKSMINSTGDSWTGKSRQSFDEEMDEAFSLFHRHADNLYKISDELKSAAEKVDRVREEIERQKELERLALIQQRNNLI